MSLEEKSLVGRNPEIIRPYLVALFKNLDDAGITWAVMRGWERLPEWTRYDIDILVARKDVRRAVEMVRSVGANCGWMTYGILRQGAMSSVWMLKDDAVTGQSYLRIDIETGNQYRGIEIHESQKCLKDRILVECGGDCRFWRMPDGYAGIAVLLKQMAVFGEVDTERRRQLVLCGLKDPEFKSLLGSTLKDVDLTNKLCCALDKKDWNAVKEFGQRVKKRLFRKIPKNLLLMALYSLSFVKGLFNPYMRCLIVLVGPDGCGKTTVADAICHRFKGRPFQGILRIHMLFGVPRMRMFKELLWQMVGKRLPPQVEAAPGTKHCGMQPPHSMFKSMMYVTYYGLGMICGRLKLLLWRPQGGLVLADRFFQDYYYMRGYMKCPKWYVRMMEFFAPTPDLIISLERPASDIYSQKPELDIEEIEREQAMIRKYLGKRKQTKIVDASHGVDATIAAVIKEVELWISSH